jgi:hypothetical protein
MLARVRWDELFSDLEAQAHEIRQREQDLEIAERTRIELARIDIQARLSAAIGADLGLRVDVLGALDGRLERLTPHWMLLGAGPVHWVVALDAVLGVRGLPVRALTVRRDTVASRLGWGAAWRVLARDRATLHVLRRDGSTLDVVADRVGEDFVELTSIRPGRWQRELVPFDAVVAVRLPRDVS